MELIDWLSGLLETASNLFIIIIVMNWLRGFQYVTLSFSVGEIRLRRKDLTVQNVTNMVSLKYYAGGQIPANVRGEIIKVTTPSFK